jgi:hypothetical protein
MNRHDRYRQEAHRAEECRLGRPAPRVYGTSWKVQTHSPRSCLHSARTIVQTAAALRPARTKSRNPQLRHARLTDLLTRRCGTEETTREVGDSQRPDFLFSETRQNAGDRGDARRSAHNPEVAGSNPAPATNFRRSGPFPGREGAFCVTGNVTKGGAGTVCRGLTSETGWHAARQRGTR